MAFSDNLMTMEQWGFHPTFNDSWFTDRFVKETEALTKVLQKSEVMPMVEMGFQTPSASGPTISGGSDHSGASSKPLTSCGGGLSKTKSKKIVKRKPRASKRALTTYITADVDSFRQMVQQVTGVRVGGVIGQVPVSSILKPEPRRPVDRVQPFCCLPTLDTSAFLLDPTSSFLQQPPPPPSAVVVDAVFGFNSFNDFPTLESGM
ncbi:unnamed protein product [Withania somnifera]